MDEKNIVWPGWEIVKRIGSGSFGAVYEIQRDVFGEIEKAALKVISIPQQRDEIEEFRVQGYDDASITKHFKEYLQDIVAEYSLMAKMKGHTNVVYCDDVRYIQHDDGIGWDIYIKMELLTPLMKALDQVTDEKQVIRLGEDICNALVLCKERNIIHRDIKPQNIFISEDGNFKLGDFGIAKTVERTCGGTKVGTYKYMAPEVYNNQPYGLTSDIYALGLVMYWLLNERRTPFLPLPPHIPTASMEESARSRRFRGEQFPPPAHGSQELKRIVMKACAFDVEQRYATANEMLADLQSLRRNAVIPVDVRVVTTENAPTEYMDTDATEYAGDDATEYAGNDATVYAGNIAPMFVDNKDVQYGDNDATEYAQKAVLPPVVPTNTKKVEDNPQKKLRSVSKDTSKEAVPKDNKKKKKFLILIPIFGLLILVGVVLLLHFCGNGTSELHESSRDQGKNNTTSTNQPLPENSIVINVVGMYESDAKALLARQGFAVKVTQSYSDAVAQGQVISQDPVGETETQSGTTVTINVSLGKEIVKHQVPNVVGQKEAEAKNTLEKLNFRVETSYSKNNSVPEGEVFHQSVKQDTELAEGSLIIIEVCSGKPTVDVANVIGKEQSTATKTLEAQGFKVVVSEEHSLTMPAGTVISQSPQPDSSQIAGSTITICVSKGKQSVRVTLDANGGNVNETSLNVYVDDTYQSLPEPTKTGYLFAGWFTAKNGGSQVTSATKVSITSSHTLYARWTADGYKVTFDANGGTTPTASKTVTYGATYGNLPEPAKTGYSFAGWFTSKSSGSQVTSATKVSTASAHTLYAHWTADGYKVTFDANGGTTPTASKTVTYGSNYGTLPTPNRDYYKFLGWYTSASGGTKITDSTTVSINKAQTLYAQWEQKPLSGWVLASSAPNGAQIVNRKWTYTKTETTTSTSTSMSGWTQTGSSWQKTGSGTYYWCAFHSGYKTSDSLYTKYHGTGAKMTASETATTKRAVTESAVHTYVYWHWVHNWGNHASYDRLISHTYNYKFSNGKKAETWEAFESTVAKTKDNSAGAYWYAYSSSNHSHWWHRETVYKQTYTDYQKLFTYQKVTNGLESTTKITASSTISNVKEYVQYREK